MERPKIMVKEDKGIVPASEQVAIRTAVDNASRLKIESWEDHAIAIQWIREFKEFAARVESLYSPHERNADNVLKGLRAARKALTDPCRIGETCLKTKATAWELEEDRKAKLAAAEQQRLLDEEVAKQKAAILKQAASASPREAEILKAAVEEMHVPVVVPDRPVPKDPGVTIRSEWDFEIKNVDEIPREYLVPDEKKIRAYVRSMKEKAQIPGIVVFQKKTMAVRKS